MNSPGEYVPDATEGITRVEDLPKAKVAQRSRNYRRRPCPECEHSAMVIFIDAPNPTGQTELQAATIYDGPRFIPFASKRIDLVTCDTVGAGTILPGEADYALFVNYYQDRVHFNEYYLSTDSYGIPDLTCCDGSTFLAYAVQCYAGYAIANDGNQCLEHDPGLGYIGGFDDSNTSGMPASVTTGLEVGIQMSRIGYGLERNDDFNIFVALMPNNDGVCRTLQLF